MGSMFKIGFVGAGNMGGAIVKGLAGRPEYELIAFDPDAAKLGALANQYKIAAAAGVFELARDCDYVVVCVKPAQVEDVIKNMAGALTPGKCLISIAAGVRLKRIKKWAGKDCPAVRVMPNTPALVGEGLFALCFEDQTVTAEQKVFVSTMFGCLGETFDLPEKHFDAFTAVAGSGPAYVYYFMEALTEAGVLLGFDRDTATRVVKGLVSGSAALAHASPKHLSELREMVTSPAGTTVAALLHLDRNAVRASIMEAVEMAQLRSEELGKEE
ncbi:MAG: pyrroline-5-carboxylate reductase [Desulfovibrionaceae bacterium]|nr:pyrroline-5-carboxylate reductase [Desulfovibrionaceae bacterium]MBF0513359.1 pyrroline-5-carboxylate reductase [Desulfovibrionaceae bacterium]